MNSGEVAAYGRSVRPVVARLGTGSSLPLTFRQSASQR